MPVIDAKQESEYTNLIGSGSAVVDFTASWCGKFNLMIIKEKINFCKMVLYDY